MKTRFIRLFLGVVLCLASTSAQGQDYTLEFKANGQLTSSPPQELLEGKSLGANIVLDQGFWTSRINATISTWFKVMENLKKFSEINAELTYGLTGTDIDEVRNLYGCQLSDYINKIPLGLLTAEQKAYYLKRIGTLGLDATCAGGGANAYAPDIKTLVEPTYKLICRFYDVNGKIITLDASIGKYSEESLLKAVAKTNMVYTDAGIPIPTGASEVRYELRLENNLNVTSMTWNSDLILPDGLKDALKTIVKGMDEKFNADMLLVADGIKKLKNDPKDPTVDGGKLAAMIAARLAEVSGWKSTIQQTNTGRKAWLLSWLWLTDGLVRINPFDSKAVLFPGAVAAKVAAETKANYEIFDNMVTKGAFQLSGVEGLDAMLKNMAPIKAALAAEASAVTSEPMAYDRLLYSGLLKVTKVDSESKFMRHLDAASNYLIMGEKPIKEITELQRLYILAENKPVAQKLSMAFSSAAVASDQGIFATMIGGLADKAGKPLATQKQVDDLIAKGNALLKIVTMLRALSPAPALPIFYERDQTPDFMTQNLEHNYLVEVPALASYSVKTIAADNTEKEVATGSYRINKLYRMRFKAGLVYSGLKKNDFTELSEGKYSLDDPAYGIDGTFGLQVYFEKQDMRDASLRPRPYVYAGLSMKKISENFYLGMGLEPLTGLGIGINAHLGRREALLGAAGVPAAIKQTWGVGFSASLLVDAALFTKILGFGANKSLLGF